MTPSKLVRYFYQVYKEEQKSSNPKHQTSNREISTKST